MSFIYLFLLFFSVLLSPWFFLSNILSRIRFFRGPCPSFRPVG
jgi:hypothetical protein